MRDASHCAAAQLLSTSSQIRLHFPCVLDPPRLCPVSPLPSGLDHAEAASARDPPQRGPLAVSKGATRRMQHFPNGIEAVTRGPGMASIDGPAFELPRLRVSFKWDDDTSLLDVDDKMPELFDVKFCPYQPLDQDAVFAAISKKHVRLIRSLFPSIISPNDPHRF